MALGDALFEVARSAEAGPKVVDAVAALFPRLGSAVVENAVAVLLIVPVALLASLTTSVRLADGAPDPRLGMVHVIVPEPPTVGVVLPQSQPPLVSRTKVVWAGMASVSVTVPASLGPLFVAPMV